MASLTFLAQPGAVYTVVLVVVALLCLHRARRAGLPLDRAAEAALAAAAGAAVGTRLFYLVITGDLLRLDVGDWFDISLGTASWGAYLGAIAGMTAYCVATRVDPWSYLDAAVSCAGLGDAIGRWSCWLAGDDFGRPSLVSWAVRFPARSLAHAAHVARGDLPADAVLSLPVHPLQLYLMANAFAVFLAISLVWRRERGRPGVTLGAFLLLYGATRFGWEYLRDPAAGGAAAGVPLSVSHWMCLTLVAAGGVLLHVRARAARSQRLTQPVQRRCAMTGNSPVARPTARHITRATSR